MSTNSLMPSTVGPFTASAASSPAFAYPMPAFESIYQNIKSDPQVVNFGIGQALPQAPVNSTVATNQGRSQATNTSLEHVALLDIYSEPTSLRKTSVICTIGPKTNTVERLTELRRAGMNIVRLNFSHGSYEFHKSIIDNLRTSMQQSPGSAVGLALDTKGPEIRTGLMREPGEFDLKAGQELLISTNPEHANDGDDKRIFCDYKQLPHVMAKDGLVYVDDGLVSLRVTETGPDWVKTVVLNPARIGSRKGINLPTVKVDLPALSPKDREDIKFGLDNGIDMVFASFIRKRADVEEIRQVLGERGKNVLIISKIENHEGMQNFQQILEATDGVMVARGDLGIEIPPEKVFLAQKMIIARCNVVGKPVICATQMLESMTYNPRPTRAEISDVANAVLDGADCVMLSGETAKGSYPIEAVSIMHKICLEAESALFYRPLFDELRQNTPKPLAVDEAIACSAVNAAFETEARAIVALTTSGNTARLLSKYHPSCPILTVSRNAQTSRQVHLYRGCYPLEYKRERNPSWERDVEERIHWAVEVAKARGFVKPGDIVIVVHGFSQGSQHTNTIRIWTCV